MGEIERYSSFYCTLLVSLDFFFIFFFGLRHLIFIQKQTDFFKSTYSTEDEM